MTEIDPNEFIEELIFCLDQQDLVKTRALLQFAKHATIPLSIQQKAVEQIAVSSPAMRFPLLDYLTRLDIPHEVIKERLITLIRKNIPGNEETFLSFLNRSNKKNRWFYIKVAREAKITSAAPALEKMLGTIKNNNIVLQIIKSLGVLGQSTSLNVLTPLICRADENAIVNAAVNAVKNIGGKKAADCLFSAITGSRIETDRILINALMDFNEEYALDKLKLLLKSQNRNSQKIATDLVLERTNAMINAISSPSPALHASQIQVQLTSQLRLLCNIAPSDSMPLLLKLLRSKLIPSSIKCTALDTMENIPCADHHLEYLINEVLLEPSEPIRLGAARVIDKNITKEHIPWLKALIKNENKISLGVVGTLIESGRENIYAYLVENRSFVKLTVHYLAKKSSTKAKNNFQTFLKKKKRFDFIARLTPDSSGNIPLHHKKTTKIHVVDDSLMMRTLLQKRLRTLGYRPKLFSSTEKDVTNALKNKPDLMIIDWNMPQMSGHHLAGIIREYYSEKELPIIMIIPQKEFAVPDRNDLFFLNQPLMKEAGITQTIQKPFTDNTLQTAISSILERIY